MSKTYISYNRQNRDFVEELERILHRRHITTWREDGTLYGEKGWPKVIGEAIADHENFLVVWSKHAAISHIIEFEWNMAFLLQRKIIAITLDESPFRESVRPDFSIPWLENKKSIPEVLSALYEPGLETDAETIQNVLKKLNRFNETKPAQVTRKMRIVYFNSRIENPRVQFY